ARLPVRPGPARAPAGGGGLQRRRPRLLRGPAGAGHRARHRPAAALPARRHAEAPGRVDRPVRRGGEPVHLVRLLRLPERRRAGRRRVRARAEARGHPRLARGEPRRRDGALPRPRLVEGQRRDAGRSRAELRPALGGAHGAHVVARPGRRGGARAPDPALHGEPARGAVRAGGARGGGGVRRLARPPAAAALHADGARRAQGRL
ncbi:MAG: SAM-dependent methyltransferase, partial [uncultured Gemmatimonadaceae bacterium]